MAEQKRIAQIMVGYGGEGYDESWEETSDGYVVGTYNINARNLWQDAPEELDGYNIVYFAEAICITVARQGLNGSGSGSARRMASYSMDNNNYDSIGQLNLRNQTWPVEDYGGSVYPLFGVDGAPPDETIEIKLIKRNAYGYYYFGGQLFLKIHAYRPEYGFHES